MNKKILWGVVVILVLIGGIYLYKQPNETTQIIPVETKEQKLIKVSKEVLKALAVKDYSALEKLTSPDGLSLSFYPNLDLTKTYSANDPKIYLFGYTDGKGDPINLTTKQFLDGIYSADYLNAPDVAVNKKLGGGNSIFALDTDIGGRDYVAFHFPGFDTKYTGFDWTTMYLVFDKVGDEYKLRGIAKDNWTI